MREKKIISFTHFSFFQKKILIYNKKKTLPNFVSPVRLSQATEIYGLLHTLLPTLLQPLIAHFTTNFAAGGHRTTGCLLRAARFITHFTAHFTTATYCTLYYPLYYSHSLHTLLHTLLQPLITHFTAHFTTATYCTL